MPRQDHDGPAPGHRDGPLKTALTLSDHFDRKVFDAIYSRSLVYNTRWEDPAVDLQALDIRPDGHLLVITSAGCNVSGAGR